MIHEELRKADLVIAAVLITGAKTPRLIKRADLKTMKPGSVIVDVAVDQGGCLETSRPTTHSDPVFIEEEVIHYCVGNMPGAVGRTSTFALCNATLPWVIKLAKLGLDQAVASEVPLRLATNVSRGKVTNQAVAETFNLAYQPLV
jgi:alanine dehydrogenase